MTLNIILAFAIFMGFCVLVGSTPKYTEMVVIFSLYSFLVGFFDLMNQDR